MTYEILLVDDEPIILSGIKFLIDWAACGCHVIGTARNGQQALESVKTLRPHIVICDINMPVMSGLELLNACLGLPEAPVFIMLTNYGEFDLAIEAMRCRAVDYLLKANLEPEVLMKSLDTAKKECDRRGGLARVEMADSYIRSNRSGMMSDSLKKLLNGHPQSPELLKPFSQGTLEDGFCLLHLVMDFSSVPAVDSLSPEENTRLFAWEQEVIEKLAGNLFRSYCAFDPTDLKQSLVLFCWEVSTDIHELVRQFYSKLCAASSNITQISLSILSTDVFSHTLFLPKAVEQFTQLYEYHYLYPKECLFANELTRSEPESLSFGDICNRLVMALRARNAEQCSQLLGQAVELTASVNHLRSDALRECTSLYSAVSSILVPMLPEHTANDFFTDTSSMISHIRCLTTRKAVCCWLKDLERHITRQLEQFTSSKSDLAEKARTYIIDNVDKRIMLQDAADYVNLSPSYLSALFKKEYGQNFVDFINEIKMERACELIREDKYRMYEISFMLGFDNAYYFTKVFKKHTGLTPTEYQKKGRS